MKKICVIHWWVKNRDLFVNTPMERYHLNHIKKYDFNSKFDKMILCIALDDINNKALGKYALDQMMEVFDCQKIEVHYLQNRKEFGEFETYTKYVLPRINNDEYLFYMHFKGVSRELISNERIIREKRWCELLYKGIFETDIMFNDRYPIAGSRIRTSDTVKDIGYWFDRWLWLFRKVLFEKSHPFLKRLNENGGFGFLDGTFQMINTVKMRKFLESKGTNINEILGIEFECMRMTHISEYLLCSFCSLDEIGYSFKDGDEGIDYTE